MKMSGADIVIECMLEQGVDTIFGYPGGSILNVYDSLYRYSDKINHVLAAHEQGAAHAADGYARSSGKVGVVFATSGPGATNLVTGIATSYMDSVPVVAITCNVNTEILGKDSFQEIDIVGITMPITKHNFLVKKAEDIAGTIRKAFVIARSGRPGPVLVDITKDATDAMAEYERIPQSTAPERKIEANAEDFKLASKIIGKSKKPLIYAGGGVISANASEELGQLAKMIDAPVTLSLMGLGAFPQNDELFTGMIGMHGTKTTSLAISECDLLITIGARFSDRATCNINTFAKNAKILQIDADRAEIDKNVKTAHSLVGDAKAVITELCKILKKQKRKEWIRMISEWKELYPIEQATGTDLTPCNIMDVLNSIDNDKVIFSTDVGQHQMWSAQYLKINSPRTFLSSGGLGTMGFGLGAAIGALKANPDAVVINITGDGCFHMNMQELSTAAQQNLPVIDIVMNNNALGMVRQWQRLFYDGRFSSTTLNKKTNYDMVANGLGANGYTVKDIEEFKLALKDALSYKDKPSVINCLIPSDELVLPMVPAGKSIEEPILDINLH